MPARHCDCEEGEDREGDLVVEGDLMLPDSEGGVTSQLREEHRGRRGGGLGFAGGMYAVYSFYKEGIEALAIAMGR